MEMKKLKNVEEVIFIAEQNKKDILVAYSEAYSGERA